MAEPVRVQLGAVQQTLFIPLAGRARESARRHPVIRDPKAAEILASVDFDVAAYSRGWGGGVTVLRTAIFDELVRDFLRKNPDGTVVELGTGLNTRCADPLQPDPDPLTLPLTLTPSRAESRRTAPGRIDPAAGHQSR